MSHITEFKKHILRQMNSLALLEQQEQLLQIANERLALIADNKDQYSSQMEFHNAHYLACREIDAIKAEIRETINQVFKGASCVHGICMEHEQQYLKPVINRPAIDREREALSIALERNHDLHIQTNAA